ncbi:hypothetical protein MmiAt1_02730 [Methanimicrococcus sp. At1]|uniref:DUF3781 domain-containing protein n=1 Tax=Methanimicrococcus hacksteinii TaxID=3028293 RepID=A0ABU3VMX2_9EURY|nr:DUF3781 domain-containing protein [Methanimicrococcus sp. At1]MDV0444737.1 hypothetical protein [Methanimicrococcus sp. At1]
MTNDLLLNIDKVHTTDLGVIRIKRNLELDIEDVVTWCRQKIENADSISKRGKNWYVNVDSIEITVNSRSFTIITAHKKKPANK